MRLLLMGVACAALFAQTPAGNAPAAKELAAISGRVTDEKGQPLRKATLTLRPMGVVTSAGRPPTPPQPYGTASDADGKFTFDGIDPGRYTLSAERQGYLRTMHGSKRGSQNFAATLNVASGQQLKDADVQMTPQSTVSGKITDEEGEPAARVRVGLLRRNFSFRSGMQYMTVGSVMTDEEGDYKLTGLTAGKYRLSATPGNVRVIDDNIRRAARDRSQQERAQVVTYYPGSPDMSSALLLDVTEGGNLQGINLRMSMAPVYHVSGTASGILPDSPGFPLRVLLLPQENGGFITMDKSAAIAKDGTFDIGRVPAGTYTLNIAKMNGPMVMVATRQIVVSNEDLNGVALVGQALSDISGTVRVEGAKPPADDSEKKGQDATARPTFFLTLDSLEGFGFNPPNTTAKPDGSFTFLQVGVGKYRVNANGGAVGGYVKSIKFGGREVIDTGLDLSEGGSGALEIVIATDGGSLSGTLNGKDGQPVIGGTITLIPQLAPGVSRPDLYRSATPRQDGQFRMIGIAPGKYRVFAWADPEPGVQYDPDFIKLHESEGQPVTIEANGTAQVTLTR